MSKIIFLLHIFPAPAALSSDEESGGECDGDATDATRPASADGATTSDGSGGHGGASFDMALEDLHVIDVVGQGGSGVVQRVTHRPTGRILARKIVQMNVQAEVSLFLFWYWQLV